MGAHDRIRRGETSGCGIISDEIMVILVTGKAGAGKTEWANRYARELQAERRQVLVVDGDEVRKWFVNDYTDHGRENNLTTIAKIAALAEQRGLIVIVAAVSPKKAWRQMMRSYWMQSRLVYIPGGTLWEGSTYERPDWEEI